MPRGNPGRLRHNLTGMQFGGWLVIAYAGRKCGKPMFRCRCSCGREKIVDGGNLMRDHRPNSRSCGHVRVQMMRAKMLVANQLLQSLTKDNQ